MYLLDTPIVFELRKARAGRTDPGLVRWISGVPRQGLFISALTIMELEATARDVERSDKASGAVLRAWLDEQVPRAFDGRILSLDAAAAKRRGTVAIADARDAIQAAIALTHGLVVVTRTPQAFKAGRVKTFNPWGFAPETVEEAADWRQVARSGAQWFQNLFLRF